MQLRRGGVEILFFIILPLCHKSASRAKSVTTSFDFFVRLLNVFSESVRTLGLCDYKELKKKRDCSLEEWFPTFFLVL